MQKTIEDIKAMSIWMLWKKRTRGAKVSKIPIAANGGGYDDKHRRYSFPHRSSAYRHHSGTGYTEQSVTAAYDFVGGCSISVMLG